MRCGFDARCGDAVGLDCIKPHRIAVMRCGLMQCCIISKSAAGWPNVGPYCLVYWPIECCYIILCWPIICCYLCSGWSNVSASSFAGQPNVAASAAASYAGWSSVSTSSKFLHQQQLPRQAQFEWWAKETNIIVTAIYMKLGFSSRRDS